MLEAPDKTKFILDAIDQHIASYDYRRAVTAQSYYSTDNEQIMKKMTYLQRQFPGLSNIKFHKITDSFYRNGVDEHVSFLMGNGLTIDKKGKFTADVKRSIDKEIDEKLKRAGKYAFVDGVAWGYPKINGDGNKKQGELFIFRQNEFVPIYDELTGQRMAGIRFTRIAEDKPLIIELFELDGLTKYVKKDNGMMEILEPKTAYRITTTRYGTGEVRIDGTENYPVLPVFPLYANDEHTTTLTTSIQSLIDIRDFLMSSQGDSQTLVEGIYWILQNYGGQNDSEIIEFITKSKILKQYDGAGTDTAMPHTLESPYEGKEAMLDRTNSLLYSAFCLPDPTVSGGITAFEIKSRSNPMDRFASVFEPNVRTFVNNILRLYGIDSDMLDFKRQISTNDTEIVNRIATQVSSGYVDEEEAIFLDPTIPEDRKEALLQRILLSQTGVPDDEEPLPDEV